MNAERPSLPHQAVEQERRILRQTVVFDEEFLEFIDDQDQSWQGSIGFSGAFLACPLAVGREGAVAGQIAGADRAKQLTTANQFAIEPLEHGEAKFSLALNGDDARMRQSRRGIGFKLDAF